MLKNSVNMVTITSAANSSLHHLQSLSSENKNSHLLEASFSSYLNSNEESFGKRLADSSREDGEIGVFSAEKYFNGGIEDSPRVVPNMPARKFHHHHQQKDKQEAAAPEETRKSKVPSSKRTTPSVHSESSWNSQSTLLKAAVKNSSRNNSKKKDQGKSFLANLGCKCYCSDKDSVDIKSTTSGEISFSKNASFGVVHEKSTPKKVFKTVNSSGLENKLVNMQIQHEEEEEKPKKSLEVFGSPILENKSRSMSFDKRLTIPIPSPSSSWDHHHIVAEAPKMEEEEIIDFSANSGGNYINDAASDASSDLFEIESLTGSKSNPFLARKTSDTSGCVTPTTCYAPSEASIEWSVITASAAPEYSVMSDCEDQRLSFASTNRKNNNKGNNRDIQRRLSGSLLGCKSHKAVKVAGDAFIRYEKASSNPQRPQVTKMASVDPRHGQHGFASQPVQRSHSPHASQHLYF